VQELAPLEQAAVLVHATVRRRGQAQAAGLADWDAAPAVEALLMQPRTCFVLAACALLLRARHEVQRARVRERGLLALHALHDFLRVRHPLPICMAPAPALVACAARLPARA
jgi:hypothetical protein